MIQQRRQAIMADIHNHLDTVMFDPSSSSLLRGYAKLSGQYRNGIQTIMEKHIDVYQAKKARNAAILTTGARWATLGVESFVISKASSIYQTVSTNYDKALQRLPAHERDTGQRLKAFADGVRKSLRQFVVHDQFELALNNNKTLSAATRRAAEDILTRDHLKATAEQFDVTGVTAQLWQQFGAELTKRGVAEADLQAGVKDVAAVQGDRRAALDRLLRFRLLGLHRETIKATARQFEHLFQQFNSNITALGMLDHLDDTLEQHYGEARGAVDSVLSQMEQVVDAMTVTHVAAVEPMAAPALPDYTNPVGRHDPSDPVTYADGEEIPFETKTFNVNYVVESGETAWKIVSEHLQWYREREGNQDLTIPQALVLLQHDNPQLVDITRVEVGDQLRVPSEPLTASADNGPYASTIPEGIWQQDMEMTTEMALMAAKGIEHHIQNDHYVEGATRSDINRLPPGDYVLVFGERMGRRDGTMGVHYDQVYDVHVDQTGEVTAKQHGVPDTTPMSSVELLVNETSPIVRIFSLEATNLKVDHGELDPDSWSAYNQSLLHYMKEHAPRVVAKDGAYCAKDMAGRFDLVGEQLASQIGVNIIDGSGNLSGVTVHAPMVAEAMLTAGGTELATLQSYFEVSASGARPQETLSSENPVYRAGVDHWIKAAAASPLEVGTFYFTGTHIQDIIAANRGIGGEPNSHVVTLLGELNHTVEVTQDTTVAAILHTRFGLSKTDLAQRGYLFESLGIEVDGKVITSEADWLQQTVSAGSELVIHDVALNQRFNGDRADSLVVFLVHHESFVPVSVLQPNAEVVNAALRGEAVGEDAVAVADFAVSKPGQGIGDVLAAHGVSTDLWKAAELALAERGVTPRTMQAGDLVPIYDEDALRSELEHLYHREEQRLADETGMVTHLVRPHESMDDVTGQFFDRGQYSDSEWSRLREQLAYQFKIPSGDKEMPGDVYVQPYSIHEYYLQADMLLQVDANRLAEIDRNIWEQRAADRMYLPDSLPIRTEDGVVETAVPKEISRLIDTVVDSNPNYGEPLRVALALVYANEGMRETADLNYYSQYVDWWNTHLPDRSATLDQVIALSEYVTSRQMQKDIAWSIQDNPVAKAVLDVAIAQTQAGIAERAAKLQSDPTLDHWLDVAGDEYVVEPVLGQLEKAAGVSSAGLFQVRANNFMEETDPEFTKFESDLRTDPLLNTQAAAEILHRNQQAIDTYASAFGDPQVGNETAQTLALVNSYNGGPYKTMLGSLQERMLYFEAHTGVDLPLDKATGRNTEGTREALVAMCDALRAEGKLALAPDQVERDVALLGTETISFLRSDTMQQLKGAYRDSTGQPLSILPTADRLNDATVSFANYALLATRGGSMEVINQHSKDVRVSRGEAVTYGYSKNDALPGAVKLNGA